MINKYITNNIVHMTPEKKEWMNNNIMKLRTKKARQHRRAQRSRREPDWIRYREARDQLHDAIKEAKETYNQKLA